MIRFLIKGLFRDRSRFLFPVIVVSLGVMLTVFLHAWIGSLMGDLIRSNAHFSTGHVRILTKAYAEVEDQMPNDLALTDVKAMIEELRQRFPDMDWVARIHFPGLLDVPDATGETRAQGPAIGLALDILSDHSSERKRLRIEKAIVRGRIPSRPGEILISDEFANRLGIQTGDRATVIGSTMNGSLTLENYTIAGTLRFGVPPMDKSALIMDIADAQMLLDMNDAAGEILGFFKDDLYNDQRAVAIATTFNQLYSASSDEFAPTMLTLRQHKGLGEYIDLAESFAGILVMVFIAAMSIVLWNAGLLGGLRRYGEFGVRLAIGEPKGHIYRTLIAEAVVIGWIGSVLGTAIGVALIYYIQQHGIDFSSMFANSGLMLNSVIRTQVTATSFYLGFIPGLFATVLGAMLAGIGVYRRNTAQLFKELEG